MLFLGIITIILIVSIAPAGAETGGVFPEFNWSGRYAGTSMYGIFLDDPFCIMYNPAYSKLVENRVGIEQKNIKKINYSALSLVKDNYGSYFIINQTPKNLNFNYNTYRWANIYALNWAELTLGLKGEVYYLSVTDISDQPDYSATGYSLGLGLDYRREINYHYMDQIYCSLLWDNIISQLNYSTETTEPVGPKKYSFAFGFTEGGFTAGLNFKKQKGKTGDYNLGIDYVYDQFSYKNLEEVILGIGFTSLQKISAGFGVGFRRFRFNYGYNFKDQETEQNLSTSFNF